MKYVNEALRGRWSEVALGETGSLVVQNIFENCLEEDKVLLTNSFPFLMLSGIGAPLYQRGTGKYRFDCTWTIWKLVYSTYLVSVNDFAIIISY